MSNNPIRQIVKKVKWQETRKKLLGQWKEHPTWCCVQLRLYLNGIHTASHDDLRIVMNYLTGTGFRTGRIKHPCISKLRDEISKAMKEKKEE